MLVVGDSRRGVRGWPPITSKMNLAELCALTGLPTDASLNSIKETARAMAERNGRKVFITLSERGILGASPSGEVEHVPCHPLRGPIDVVGAGDSVTANLTAALAAGAALRESLELAMAADFRIAAEDSRFGFTEGNINLIPGSGGCSRLVKMIGPGWTKELVMAGEFIDAQRALQIGLTTRVVAKDKLVEESRALADTLVKKAPQAIGAAKAVINACQSIDATSGRILERMAQSALILSQDHKEGVKAFREKRPPQYQGR